VPPHNVLIILGDFNAHVGKDDGSIVFHQDTNRNGKLFTELSTEKSLIIANTIFQKRESKLWTYISLSGDKSQLDYILIRKKWRNSIHNVEPYSTFASVGSDLRVVLARVKLSLRSSEKSPAKQTKLDWKKLRDDTSMQDQSSIKVQNRFQALASDQQSCIQKYESFITANRKTAEELLPGIRREKKHAHSNDPGVFEQRERMKKAYHTYQEHTDEGNRQELEEAKGRLEEAYKLVAEEELASHIHEVEEVQKHHKYSRSWQLINEISRIRTPRKGQLKGTSQQERVKNWYEHFQRLLGAPPEFSNEDEDIPPILKNLNIKTGPFDMEEYAKAKKSITEGKSCGEDGITPEVMKRCNIDSIILDFCNAALTEREGNY